MERIQDSLHKREPDGHKVLLRDHSACLWRPCRRLSGEKNLLRDGGRHVTRRKASKGNWTMFLSGLFIENFRTFGCETNGRHLEMKLRRGLNVLAGENDSGKTAVIDALRHILWTTSFEYHRLTEDDFHVSGEGRANSLRVSCVFSGLSDRDAARFLEWLSVDEQGKPILQVWLDATRMDDSHSRASGRRRVAATVRSGKNGDGPAIEGEIREFLRATYLRPLRDAEGELAAGKGSRLSQILQSHPEFQDQGTDDFDQAVPEVLPKTLVGIMRHAEHRIANNDVITAARKQLNEEYLDRFSIADDTLTGSIGVARSTELRQILEKLELQLDPPADLELPTPRGLGFNNVLFMATELLLLGEAATGAVPLLLIEEPEAHLHPQMQLRLMDFLEDKCLRADSSVQVLLTTHSPNLASNVDLESITLMHKGRAFSLASDCTKLDGSDYRFLRRFLDVTKANLFFAKGVVIVEGDAENILLPLLAELLDRSFSKNGISVVNVGHVGLFRYARIFQRKDGKEMPVRVACLADRDIPPEIASYYVPKRKNKKGDVLSTFDSDFDEDKIQKKITALMARDGGSVKTFVSPVWTLEHDLATNPELAEYVHVAIQLARQLKKKPEGYGEPKIRKPIVRQARQEIKEWRDDNLSAGEIAAKVYEDLYRERASKAEAALVLAELLRHKRPHPEKVREMLPDYINDAIDYVTGKTDSGEESDAVGN